MDQTRPTIPPRSLDPAQPAIERAVAAVARARHALEQRQLIADRAAAWCHAAGARAHALQEQMAAVTLPSRHVC